MDESELIDLIKEYAEHHNSFDTDFIDSVEDSFNEYGQLTHMQSQACERIVSRFRMKQWKRDRENNPTCDEGNEPWNIKEETYTIPK